MFIFAKEARLGLRFKEVDPLHPRCFIAHWHHTGHIPGPTREWHCTHGCSQKAGRVRLQTFWLPPPYSVLQHSPRKICVPLNAYSRVIVCCKQFLAKASCYENTTLVGSDTVLTAFQNHGTTEEDTKDDSSVLVFHVGSTIWSRGNPVPSTLQNGFDQVTWPQACFI